MKSEKGITLAVLTVTVIVLIIITGVVIQVGKEDIDSSKVTTFIARLKMMQAEVNVIYEKIKAGDTSYLDYGASLGLLSQEKYDQIVNNALKGRSEEELAKFKYYSSSELKKMGINDIDEEMLINFTTNEVVSVNGVKDRNGTYYKLSDFKQEGYNVTTQPIKGDVSFNVTMQATTTGWNITVKDVSYPEGVKSAKLSYKLKNQTDWKIVDGYSFHITTPGIYHLKVLDASGNFATKTIYAYVPNGLKVYLDAENNTESGHDLTTTTWKDLSGNGNDANLINFNQDGTSGWQEKELLLDGVDDYATFANTQLTAVKEITVCSSYSIQSLQEGTAAAVLSTTMLPTGSTGKLFFGYGSALGENIPNRNTYVMDYSQPETWIYGHANAVSLGKKQSLIATYTGTNTTANNCLYLNGEPMVKNETAMRLAWGSTTLEIGRTFGGGDAAYPNANIKLSTILMYDRTLTAEEIKANYEIDKARFSL